jgi:hypothetical protein
VSKPKRRREEEERRPAGLAFKGPLLLVALLMILAVLILAYEGNGTLVNNVVVASPSPAVSK